jgi:hypothetical protein
VLAATAPPLKRPYLRGRKATAGAGSNRKGLSSLVLSHANAQHAHDSSLYSMHKRVAHLPYFWNSQSLLSAHSRKSVRRSEKIFLPPLQCSEQLSPIEVIFAHSSPPRPHAGRVPHSLPDTKCAHRETLGK